MTINKTYIWKPADRPYWQYCLYDSDPSMHDNAPDLFKTQKECIAYCQKHFPTFPILIQKDSNYIKNRIRTHLHKTIGAVKCA
jgi:hypothetical protein